MSAQLIELLCFALLAFFLLNRLISILGTTSEEDPTRKKSFYGEPTELKDVTQAYATTESSEFKTVNTQGNIDDLIATDDKINLLQNLNQIAELSKNFTAEKFIKSAKLAFNLTIDALRANDQPTLHKLVDKRYVDNIYSILNRYISLNTKEEISAKICDALIFGNNCIVKVLFSTLQFKEEWTFQKNISSNNINWFVTNVDVAK